MSLRSAQDVIGLSEAAPQSATLLLALFNEHKGLRLAATGQAWRALGRACSNAPAPKLWLATRAATRLMKKDDGMLKRGRKSQDPCRVCQSGWDQGVAAPVQRDLVSAQSSPLAAARKHPPNHVGDWRAQVLPARVADPPADASQPPAVITSLQADSPRLSVPAVLLHGPSLATAAWHPARGFSCGCANAFCRCPKLGRACGDDRECIWMYVYVPCTESSIPSALVLEVSEDDRYKESVVA